MIEKDGPAAKRYNELCPLREPFLRRARACALYTIPSLVPPEGHNSSTEYPTPYQSLGAKGLNNIASKMLLALLPPASTFFRLMPDSKIVSQLQPEEKDILDGALSVVEQEVLKGIESLSIRTHCFEAFKHLAVGNVLLHLPEDGVRVFPLSSYVVHRDPAGNVLEIVVKEVVSPSVLPEGVKALATASEDTTKNPDKTVCVYTHVSLCDDSDCWQVYQECKGEVIPDSEGTYPADKCPWLPLRWTRIDGESYGRGLCEEYLGDLISFEGLSKAIVEWGAMASKVLFMVKPGSIVRTKQLVESPNGGFVEGDREDVGVLQIEKYADFQVVSKTAETIEQRLKEAFLLNSAIQRQAERVTAEEIRYMAGELEDALGGVYSLMAAEFQLPLVKLVMAHLERKGKLPKLPKNTITPTIVTGLDALGRSHEIERLDALLSGAIQTFGPQVMQYINLSDYLTRKAAGLGIDPKGLIKPQQQIDQENSSARMQAMAEKVGPQVVNSANQQYMAAAQLGQQPQQGEPQNGNS